MEKEQKYNILVCDDEKEIVDAIEIYLMQEGYNVLKAYNGRQALDILKDNEIHLLILDLMMPELDGIHTVMEIRKENSIPIIILSAKSQDADKILGLNVGADDYVTKPFAPMELLARVNSQLRRYRKYLDILQGNQQEKHDRVISVGGLELDEEKAVITLDGAAIHLTPIEYKMLALMMKHPGRVFSAEELYEKVWNEKAITTDTVMVHIRKIREKIEIDPKNPRYLKVVWGVGYKIEE